jgi:hypothetical protein
VEPGPDIRHVVNELERAPDAVILPFLARLRTRREDLAHAMQGRVLRVELVLEGQRRTVYRLVFTSTGNVELTGAHGFDPHVRLEGQPEHVVGVVVGTVDTFTAVYKRVLTLLLPAEELPQYPVVRRLIAQEVRSCRPWRRR